MTGVTVGYRGWWIALFVAGCGGNSLSLDECKTGEELRGGQCMPVATCGKGTYLAAGVCLPDSSGGAGSTGGVEASAAGNAGDGGVTGIRGGVGNDSAGAAGLAGSDVSDAGSAGAATTDAGAGGLSAVSGAGGSASGGTAGVAGNGGRAGGSAGAIDGHRDSGNYLIDAAHDNLQPNDAVASPLSQRWSVTLSSLVTYPAVAQGRVFVGTNDGAVTALDAETGHTVWGPHLFPSDNQLNARVLVAIELGRAYALTRSGLLSSLDPANGNEAWSEQLKGQYFFWSAPVAAGGFVYVNGLESGGTTYAVNGATGSVAWTAGTFDGSEGTVAVTGDRVYEAEACDQLSAFLIPTGKLDWYTDSNCTGGGGKRPRSTTVGFGSATGPAAT